MNATVTTSIFKNGNSLAVRLPKDFGFGLGESVELIRHGRSVEIRPTLDPVKEKQKVMALVRRLNELGPVEGAEIARHDGRIEFPDRPGLY